MRLIGERDALLADTGPFCRLAEAGEQSLDVALDYLAPIVRVVKDVDKELQRRATRPVHDRLNRLSLLGVPRHEPITLTDAQLLSDIATILARRRERHPDHEEKDKGELVTVLAAHSLGLPVLMDDGWGKRMAASRGVEVFTTQDLAVELCALDRLRPVHAFGLFRIVYSTAERSDFDSRVATLTRALGHR